MFDRITSGDLEGGERSQELQKLDELDMYLKADPDKTVTDPIGWWHKHRDVYPRLSRMAMDYLSIPRTYHPDLYCLS